MICSTHGNKSVTASDLSHLARDLPVSERDVAALRAARPRSAMSLAEIVATLEQLGSASIAALESRPVSTGEPFALTEDP